MSDVDFSDAVSVGISNALNARGRSNGLVPLVWRLSHTDSGVVGQLEFVHEDCAREHLAAWAKHLGLVEASEHETVQCTAAYLGRVDSIRVEIWGVVDREGWEQIR